MNQEILFYLVGTEYCDSTIIEKLHEGYPVELVPEPDNVYDEMAIRVTFQGNSIGYVPNTGYTCNECGSSVKKGDSRCSICYSEDFVKGGLAYRMHKKSLFSEHMKLGAFISQKKETTNSPTGLSFKITVYFYETPNI